LCTKIKQYPFPAGLKLEKRIEEAVPAGQQLQELGMRLRCDDMGSENVNTEKIFQKRTHNQSFD